VIEIDVRSLQISMHFGEARRVRNPAEIDNWVGAVLVVQLNPSRL